MREQGPSEESDWIPVTDGSRLEGFSWWSPSGDLLYYLSDRDGSTCIWARRLDSSTRNPVGDPVEVQHFDRQRLSFSGLIPSFLKVSVGGNRIVFTLRELAGNVWMAEM